MTTEVPAGERGGDAVTLALRDVTKTFPGQVAVNRVDLDLRPGQIHGLVGQNGCGKSTLIKIMAGFHAPDPGAGAWFDGEPFELGSASAAEQAGMRFIHQDLGLVPTLNTVDNLALGHGYESRRFVRLGGEARRARALLAEFGFEFDVGIPMAQLTPVQRTGVAIARAMSEQHGRRLRVLVLDEPTASFDSADVAQLFAVLRHASSRGVAILYVSHRLDEILEITHETTVLRDGRLISTVPTEELSHESLIELILGQAPEPHSGGAHVHSSEVRLSVEHLRGGPVRDVSFVVHAGEIVGLAGIVGSGRDLVPYLVGGAQRPSGGSVLVDGEPVARLTPRGALRRGLVFVPGDRQGKSAIASLAVRENLTLPRLPTRGPARWLGVRHERREASTWLERFDVRPRQPDRPLATLSGGNQQKVVLARAMRCDPRVLVIDEPVHGVDVGAKRAIYELLREATRQGVGALLASGDVDDLAAVCDRVVVLRDGIVVAELHGRDNTVDRITRETLARQNEAT
ncbi:MAG: sugar transporter ATP-binding protein [Conexibacter sp.]|nr:sugar transporter ATP-binding protein [Conexibacter sp.]MDX6713855.1 ribose transport system ATP-binding protein [Baekduia sp.]